jgi:chemotaxis protein methyltransferase CheR
MIDKTMSDDISSEVSSEVLSSPTLLFLYYRIEQILGIKSKAEPLKKLNEYIEESCGYSFIENSSFYENFLSSKKQIFNFSKFFSVNETYFFRESAHFKLLADLLPDFTKLNRPVQICSAASSIGCEAYSIAMLIDYYSKRGLPIDFSIDAFDVNNEAVETAKNACYTANSFRNDGSDWKHILDSYLESEKSEFVVKQNIKRKVRFFSHNIMTPLERQYDIIFFNNALIYFSSGNRLTVLNNLSNSLLNGGLLFLSASETSAVKHPLLSGRFSSDVFYFQKIAEYNTTLNSERENLHSENIKVSQKKKNKSKLTDYPQVSIQKDLAVNYMEISDILKNEEGKDNAEHIMDMIANENTDFLYGSPLAAAVIYYLHNQDFDYADKILSFLEKYNKSACARFLRGEFYFLLGNAAEAEKYFQEASLKDKYFWPAFYRISVLCSEGNQTRYKYKIKKAIESIELSHGSEQAKALNYEFFLGGFSPDYFLRILEKKLA